MKTMRIVLVCALSMLAGLGCGKKEADAPAAVDQQAPEKTGNQVLDNLATEEAP